MPPQSSALFIFSGRATSVGEQKAMEQMTLFDVLLERNEHHEPPRPPPQFRDRRRQTDLHAFLGLAPRPRAAPDESMIPSDDEQSLESQASGEGQS